MSVVLGILPILAATLGVFSGGTPSEERILTVALDGSASFRSVQAAIDSLPAADIRPTVIHIRPGIYKERLRLGTNHPHITLKGDRPELTAKTVLTYNLSARSIGADGKPVGTTGSASVTLEADDFTAENLTFANEAGSGRDVGQAVAVKVLGDRCAFYHCRFLGSQDTLYASAAAPAKAVPTANIASQTVKGTAPNGAMPGADRLCRQYYRDCYIEGGVDFIFGSARAVFDHCRLHSNAPGAVTAHARTSAEQPGGYLFQDCDLTADASVPAGSVILGRPWRPYARVIYRNCTLGAHISPAGWGNWNDPEREKTTFYAEENCTGPGADRSARVAWAHTLTPDEASEYTATRFLAGSDGWKPVAPAPDTTAIPAPKIPNRIFRITDFGAVGDGKTKNTTALKKAIADCKEVGGGTILVPAGRFLTGPFALSSNMELRLEKDAVLLLSDNPADYKITDNRFEDGIVANDCHDIALTGDGTIDGQGSFWWKNYVKPKNAPPGTPEPTHRPFLIVLTACTRVLVQGITLQNSPMFHLVPQRCRDVHIEGITLRAPLEGKNTDGIDPSGWNYLIANCTFDVGDDCIALKPTGLIEAGQPSCRDFLIRNCVFRHGHGMSVGGQTPGGLKNLTVRDCTFEGTDAGIRLKAARGSGGLVEDLTYENLTMKDVKVAIEITSYYAPSGPKVDPASDPAQTIGTTTPIWRNIRIRNVTATGSKEAGHLFGLAEMPLADILLTNVHISATKAMQVIHAKNVRFEKSSIMVVTGKPLISVNSTVTGL